MFIADMDSSLRQIGIGDYVVGKHVGRMMGALGGRLAALREAEDSAALSGAVERNIFRGAPPSAEALALVDGAARRVSSGARGNAARPPDRRGTADAMTEPEFSRPVRLDTLGSAPSALLSPSRRGRAGGARAAFRPDRARWARGRPDAECARARR